MVALKQLKSSTSVRTKKHFTKVNKKVAPSPSKYLKSLEKERGIEGGAILLRGLRKREGLTQAEFAVALGLSENQRNNISLMENGHRPISKQMALKIGGTFGVNYQLLL